MTPRDCARNRAIHIAITLAGCVAIRGKDDDWRVGMAPPALMRGEFIEITSSFRAE